MRCASRAARWTRSRSKPAAIPTTPSWRRPLASLVEVKSATANLALADITPKQRDWLDEFASISVPAIGQLLDYDAQTVRTWLWTYPHHGCAGLDDAPRSGRPPKEAYLTAVVQAQASQPPPHAGYLQACWTSALLVLHLAERFRIIVGPTAVRRALSRAGFRWTQPKLAPARRPDPDAPPSPGAGVKGHT